MFQCIPWKFIHCHRNRLNDTVKLRFRNGYIIRVTFDRQNSRFVGMHDLFRDFGLKGGEILLFKHVKLSEPGTNTMNSVCTSVMKIVLAL